MEYCSKMDVFSWVRQVVPERRPTTSLENQNRLLMKPVKYRYNNQLAIEAINIILVFETKATNEVDHE